VITTNLPGYNSSISDSNFVLNIGVTNNASGVSGGTFCSDYYATNNYQVYFNTNTFRGIYNVNVFASYSATFSNANGNFFTRLGGAQTPNATNSILITPAGNPSTTSSNCWWWFMVPR
jgi:hypothetical protein